MADRGFGSRRSSCSVSPPETLDEIRQPSDAVNATRTSYFFNVVPQPGTPLYDLALEENAAARAADPAGATTRTRCGMRLLWRQHAGDHETGILPFLRTDSRRWLQMIRMMLEFSSTSSAVSSTFSTENGQTNRFSEELLPLSKLYSADDITLTSAQAQRTGAASGGRFLPNAGHDWYETDFGRKNPRTRTVAGRPQRNRIKLYRRPLPGARFDFGLVWIQVPWASVCLSGLGILTYIIAAF